VYPRKLTGATRSGAAALVGLVATMSGIALSGAPAEGGSVSPFDGTWCTSHGANVVGWVEIAPEIPICGPGASYGSSSAWIDIPGPYGSLGTYYNATPGFQCVELAERFLAVAAGLAPVKANGAQVALAYHAAYPATGLVLNGSNAAVGNPPVAGSVISFSSSPDFYADDGHVAVVVNSSVDAAGNGTVTIAQENVASSDYVRNLSLQSWHLVDPTEGPGTEYSYPYAEWLDVPTLSARTLQARLVGPVRSPVANALQVGRLPSALARLLAGRS
jgi:hypothetical protein